MTKDDLHHPVTNGQTKKMVWMSLVFIFVITMTALSMAFAGSFHLSGMALYLMKGTFGGISITGLGALVSVTRKFFDTRTSEVKARDRLHLKQEAHAYKLSKWQLKHDFTNKKQL